MNTKRSKRDTERKNFIIEMTLKNLESVKNDPESLFSKEMVN